MFVILSCYFLSRLLFSTSSVKAFSWREFLTFQEYRVGPSGGHFRGSCLCVAALDCLSERKGREGMEMEMGGGGDGV